MKTNRKYLKESLNEDLLDGPRNIADSICKYLDSKNFYNYELVDYDSYPMNTSKITFEVDGDWKHDHLYFKDLVFDWSFDSNKSIYKIESELVRDDGSDDYASNYFIYVTENEDSLNELKSMSKLFSEEYEDESLSEGLDPWYGKYVPIDIGGSKGTPRKVYFYFDSTDFDEAEEEFLDIIPEPYVKAKLYGRASESSLVKDGWKSINEDLNREKGFLNKKLREATENEWWTRYLKRASEQELLNLSGASSIEEFNSDICGSCEDLPGYDAKHIDWLIPKDEYFDVLADDGYDIIELCEMDGEQFLGYTVGDRLYDVGDEVEKCCRERQKGTGLSESASRKGNIEKIKKAAYGDEILYLIFHELSDKFGGYNNNNPYKFDVRYDGTERELLDEIGEVLDQADIEYWFADSDTLCLNLKGKDVKIKFTPNIRYVLELEGD